MAFSMMALTAGAILCVEAVRSQGTARGLLLGTLAVAGSLFFPLPFLFANLFGILYYRVKPLLGKW